MHRALTIFVAVLGLVSTACTSINQGEVGFKRVWGKLDPTPLQPGLIVYEQVSTDIIKIPIRTVTKTIELNLPSKEGLTINSQISILYRIEPRMAATLVASVGLDYEEGLISAVFRSAAADVSANFLAKDMHSGKRRDIEQRIREVMRDNLEKRGIVVEAVLMKSISLPPGLAQSVEAKLSAEQDVERMQFQLTQERAQLDFRLEQERRQMEFRLKQEKLEAERKLVEATGIRDAQRVIAEGLSPILLQYRSIEAFEKLSGSDNSKVIITDGKSPLLVTPPAGSKGAYE